MISKVVLGVSGCAVVAGFIMAVCAQHSFALRIAAASTFLPGFIIGFGAFLKFMHERPEEQKNNDLEALRGRVEPGFKGADHIPIAGYEGDRSIGDDKL